MSDDDLPEGTELRTWTYAGARVDHKRTPKTAWVTQDGDVLLYGNKGRPTPEIIGGIYTVPSTEPDGGTAYFGDLKYTGEQEENQEIVAEWKVQAAAAKGAKTTKAAENKIAKESQDLSDLTLAEIRTAMWTMNKSQETATIGIVVRYLLKGGTL